MEISSLYFWEVFLDGDPTGVLTRLMVPFLEGSRDVLVSIWHCCEVDI